MSAASSSSAKAASKERLLPPDEEAPRLPDETNANIDTSGITFESVDLEKQIPTESMEVDEESDDEPVERKPKFRKLNPGVANPSLRKQLRRIAVPQHRFTPLRNAWEDICLPLVEHMKLQVGQFFWRIN